MKIIELLTDNGYRQHQTEGHKHCRPGWVNMPCPFCTGNPGLHLGYNMTANYFYCWRCGWKPKDKAIAAILGVSLNDSKKLIAEYGGREKVAKIEKKINKKPFKLPSNCGKLNQAHKKYLKRRKYNPKDIIEKWKIMGCGPVSTLDKRDYKNRIIIPIFWGNKIVSFQGRIIKDGVEPKYKACPKDREDIHHKKIIYKHPSYDGDIGICVEGTMDAWRIGPMAFAIFGASYKTEQVLTIGRLYNRVVILLDNDGAGKQAAKKLEADLNMIGLETMVLLPTSGDPGNMTRREVNRLLLEIKRKNWA